MDTQTRHKEPLRIVLLVIAAIALVAFAYAMRGVFAVMTVSVVFYYMLDPIVRWFDGRRIGRKIVVPRLCAVVIAFLTGILAITLFFFILIPPIVEQVQRFTENIPEYTSHAEDAFETLQQKYRRLELPPEIQDSVRRAIEKAASESTVIVRHAAEKSAHFFSQIILIFMIPFVTFYLLLEKNAVKEALVRAFPRARQAEAAAIISESSQALRGYITGQIVLSVIMGVSLTFVLGVLGVKAPLLLGLVAGVTKLIPVIGIFLGCIPAAFVALSSSLTLALWVIAIFTIIQVLENKVILPVLLSRYVDLSPLTILLAIIAGEQLGGVLGMFIATPAAAVLRIVYVHARAKYD